MTPTSTPVPSWLPLAHSLIADLQANEAAKQWRERNLGRPSGATTEQDVSDDIYSADVDAEDMPLPKEEVAAPLEILHETAALMIAATFVHAQHLTALAAPGAVTVLQVDWPALLAPCIWVLERALPSVRQAAGRKGLTPVKIMAPRPATGFSGRHEQTGFQDKVRAALGVAAPIVLLITSDQDLGPELGALLPRPRPLAPMDADVLRQMLPSRYPALAGAGAPPLLLPQSVGLRGLSPDALIFALRAPDPHEAVTVLQTLGARYRKDLLTLDDIEGYGEAEAAARRLVADLAAWKAGEARWSDLPHALLFYGAPGTGKTFLVRALAGSTELPVVSASFAEWQAAGHLGQMLAAMRASFAEARRLAPAILFIDEIDAVGARTSETSHNSQYQRQVINGFLAEVDGYAAREGVVILGACNDLTAIDPAVLRPGRFDLLIEVPLPGKPALARILHHHLRDDLPETVIPDLLRHAIGCSAADVAGAVRRARSVARNAGRALTEADVARALAPEEAFSTEIEHRTAIHEAGHAIVGQRLNVGQIVRLMLNSEGGLTTILPHHSAGTLAEVEAQLAMHMAGRAAELLILGEASSGAGIDSKSDLAQATQLALSLETGSGLGSAGLVWTPTTPADLTRAPGLHARIQTRLATAQDRAMAELEKVKPLIPAMAKALQSARLLEGHALATWLRAASQDDHFEEADGKVISVLAAEEG